MILLTSIVMDKQTNEIRFENENLSKNVQSTNAAIREEVTSASKRGDSDMTSFLYNLRADLVKAQHTRFDARVAD